MASNLRVVPQPAMPPGPATQGWVWNGTNWMWDPDCDPCQGFQPPFPCPPSGFPTPCPPWFPPPAGQAPWYPGANGGVSFSATPPANPVRGNFWWDGTMLHLFDGAAWVDIGPSAAGGAGGAFVGVTAPSNPASGALWWNGTIFQVWDGAKWQAVGPQIAGALKGVTDGSVAAAGVIGEVVTQSANGNLSVTPPPGATATSFQAIVLSAGDWNVQGTVTISDMTNGVYYDYITFQILNGASVVSNFNLAGNFTSTAGGIVGGTYSGGTASLSVAASTTLTGTVQVVGLNGGSSGTAAWKFVTFARRMR